MLSRTRTSQLAVALCALLCAAPAWAAPGDGLQAGNLSISPAASVTAAFDTNVYRLSLDERTPIAAPYVEFVPSLTISSRDGDLVDFSVDARVGWQQYIPLGDRIVLGTSGLFADVGAGLTFNRAGAVSFALNERLQRTNEPPPDPANEAYNRLTNRVGATLGIHPGGRVFQHYLSYDWMLYAYDEFPDLNKQAHDFTLKNYWRFLPRTAVVLNGDFQIVQYADAGARPTNIGSKPLRVTGGLSGLITRRLSLRLIGGWGWGFYSAGDDFSSFLLDTQLAFDFGNLAEKNKLFLGYERNFQDASISTYASYHRPYAGYEQGFANRRLRLSIRGEAMIRSYENPLQGDFATASGETVSVVGQLDDLLVAANAGLEFNIYRWWVVGGRYHFGANFTDDRFAVSDGSEVVREYTRHLVTLTTTVRY